MGLLAELLVGLLVEKLLDLVLGRKLDLAEPAYCFSRDINRESKDNISLRMRRHDDRSGAISRERKSVTVNLGGFVQQGGLVVQLIVDLNDLSGDGSVDVGGSLDRLDGSDGVYEVEDADGKKKEGCEIIIFCHVAQKHRHKHI